MDHVVLLHFNYWNYSPFNFGFIMNEIDEGYHSLALLKKVCDQIIEDHTISKDWTAIDELFKDIPTKHLKGFLTEL